MESVEEAMERFLTNNMRSSNKQMFASKMISDNGDVPFSLIHETKMEESLRDQLVSKPIQVSEIKERANSVAIDRSFYFTDDTEIKYAHSEPD